VRQSEGLRAACVPRQVGPMTTKISIKRLGFFTRLLDETSAAERYRLAIEQIGRAHV